MPRNDRNTYDSWFSWRARLKMHLRYELHDDGSRTYHLAANDLDRDRLCGDGPTEPCVEAEEAAALRLILGHDEGDVTWCPECLSALVADFTGPQIVLTPNISPPQAHSAWRKRYAETRGRDPIADGYRAQWRRAALAAEGEAIRADLAPAHGEDAVEAEAINPDPEGETA